MKLMRPTIAQSMTCVLYSNIAKQDIDSIVKTLGSHEVLLNSCTQVKTQLKKVIASLSVTGFGNKEVKMLEEAIDTLNNSIKMAKR